MLIVDGASALPLPNRSVLASPLLKWLEMELLAKAKAKGQNIKNVIGCNNVINVIDVIDKM